MALNTAQTFVESRYKSPIVGLCVDLENRRVTGSYSTPAAAGMLGGYVHGFTKGYGHSYIDGHLSWNGDEPGTIEGNWRHDPGPLTAGKFKMTYDPESKSMRGWWAETDTGCGRTSERNDWVWEQSAGLTSTLAWLVQSIVMARYTVACCDIYVLFTIIQLLLAIYGPVWSTSVQQWFNAFYALTYLSFLGAYVYMQKRPPMAYTAGIVLYQLGYTAFYVLYTVSSVSETCYIIGSVLFLMGSLSLVMATLPSSNLSKYSPFTKSTSLFWGSFCFLVGSVAFTWDAVAHYNPGNPATPWLSQAGYTIFIVGRFYFVWGSVTPSVGVFLQGTPLTTVIRNMRSGSKQARDVVRRSHQRSSAASEPLAPNDTELGTGEAHLSVA